MTRPMGELTHQQKVFKRAVNNAKQIQADGGYTIKEVKVYNRPWKKALAKGFDLAKNNVALKPKATMASKPAKPTKAKKAAPRKKVTARKRK